MKATLKNSTSVNVKKVVEDRLSVLREEAIRAKLAAEQEAARAARPRGILGGRFI